LPVNRDILATLAYFDIFDYPITQTEISQFLQHNYPQKEFLEGLHQLTIENWIYKYDEFYSLQDDYSLVIRRRKGNLKAKEIMVRATKIAAFLSGFPFVKGVAVSGSLSKNFADENSDIDFFIITEKNKLWIARTIMHCFKKLTYLFKKQDWFCMNYYIDEAMLQIKEKNIYTATEIATLLPLRGVKTFQDFFIQNKWSKDFLPNHLRVAYTEEVKSSLFAKAIELLFRNPLGKLCNTALMKITAARWRKKTSAGKLNKRRIVLSMDASEHYAKPSPENFQRRLMEIYRNNMDSLLHRYENKAESVF
jgi:predicted nucleotidyltransferase